MLNLQNISVMFNETPVLNNINANLKPGDFVVIVGPNGAGKSTLMQTIVGSVLPKEGSLWLDSKDITQTSALKRAPFIGRVHQNPLQGTISDMTVEQNLAIACYKGTKVSFSNAFKKWKKIKQNSSQIGLDKDFLSKPMAKLSGGQRQLIAFIMATIHPCKILLLDEPTAALDPKSSEQMLESIDNFVKTHKPITLLVTHNLDDALRMGNQLWIIKEGRLEKQFQEEEKKTLSAKDLKKMIYQG